MGENIHLFTVHTEASLILQYYRIAKFLGIPLNFLYFFSVSGVYWWHIYVSRLLVVIMPALSFSQLFRKFSSASEINLGRYFLWERGIRSIDSLANILYIVWNYVLFYSCSLKQTQCNECLLFFVCLCVLSVLFVIWSTKSLSASL